MANSFAKPRSPVDASRFPSSIGGTPTKKPRGIVTALITPMTDGHRLDEPALEGLLERQIRSGIHGIFVLGSVGEGPLLSDTMSADVARRTTDVVGGRCPVLGGAIDNSVDRCLRRLDMLAEAGVDIGVLTLPCYGWPHRVAESVSFFKEVAERSPLPIMAYDLPKVVGWRMPLELIEALFEIRNLIGLKCTHGDTAAMLDACYSPKRPGGFAFLPGNSALVLTMLQAGADGLVCTPSNVFPEPFVDLYRAFEEKRFDAAQAIADHVVPGLVELLGILPNGAGSIKAVLEVQGLARRFTAPPWPQASDKEMELAKKILEKINRTLKIGEGLPVE
jgi:4-hydroxy-tetrahydrodipicolinate synthase